MLEDSWSLIRNKVVYEFWFCYVPHISGWSLIKINLLSLFFFGEENLQEDDQYNLDWEVFKKRITSICVASRCVFFIRCLHSLSNTKT